MKEKVRSWAIFIKKKVLIKIVNNIQHLKIILVTRNNDQ